MLFHCSSICYVRLCAYLSVIDSARQVEVGDGALIHAHPFDAYAEVRLEDGQIEERTPPFVGPIIHGQRCLCPIPSLLPEGGVLFAFETPSRSELVLCRQNGVHKVNTYLKSGISMEKLALRGSRLSNHAIYIQAFHGLWPDGCPPQATCFLQGYPRCIKWSSLYIAG